MGLDAGHMSYRELSQAVLPEYASYVLGQAARQALQTRQASSKEIVSQVIWQLALKG